MSTVRIDRSWIRGAFRVESPAASTRGFVTAIVAHALACALALSSGLAGIGAPRDLAREETAPVVVELPRIEPEARVAARFETPEPPAPGPAAPPAHIEAPAPAAPAPRSAVREAPEPIAIAETSAEDARAAQEALAAAAAARAQAARDAEAIAARAKVSESLAGITSSLDDVLGGLASATEARAPDAAASSRGSARSANVRSARGGEELGAVPAAARGARGGAGAGSAPLLASSSWEPAGGGGSADARGRGARSGASGGALWDGVAGEGVATGDRVALASDARSNASLLAIIRRYASGIQFCYENELAKSAGLGGRLVVSMTVAPGGEVTSAVVTQDTVGSAQLASCVIAQVRGWKFPAIPEGVVTFKTPFLFTPPS